MFDDNELSSIAFGLVEHGIKIKKRYPNTAARSFEIAVKAMKLMISHGDSIHAENAVTYTRLARELRANNKA